MSYSTLLSWLPYFVSVLSFLRPASIICSSYTPPAIPKSCVQVLWHLTLFLFSTRWKCSSHGPFLSSCWKTLINVRDWATFKWKPSYRTKSLQHRYTTHLKRTKNNKILIRIYNHTTLIYIHIKSYRSLSWWSLNNRTFTIHLSLFNVVCKNEKDLVQNSQSNYCQ